MGEAASSEPWGTEEKLGSGVKGPQVRQLPVQGLSSFLTQESLRMVAVLLGEAGGGMEDVGESNHGDGHCSVKAG